MLYSDLHYKLLMFPGHVRFRQQLLMNAFKKSASKNIEQVAYIIFIN